MPVRKLKPVECWGTMTQKKSPNRAQEFAFDADTLIFEEGAPGTSMYVIREGRVKICKQRGKREIVLAFLGSGEFFGEMALLEGLPRSASAIAVEPSVIVEVNSATFKEMIRRNIEIAVRIMRRLSGRVRELDTRLERVLLDDALERALDVLRWLLPQGLLEGRWVRIQGAAAHLDITAQAGIPSEQSASIHQSLQRAGVMKTDGEDLLVAETDALDSYAAYLRMRRLYRDEAKKPDGPDQDKALRRLMSVLKLSPDEIDKRQQALAHQYERYMLLKQRFETMERSHP
ncbi:MAG: cyclic nucleotide-binding domain-containing protein [Myxococcota bacterium]